MDNLPHEPGGLLAQSATATLGNSSNNVVNSYQFKPNTPASPQVAVVSGTSQATGASVVITGPGQVTPVSGSPTFGSTVTVSDRATNSPSGKNIVQSDVSISAPSGVPSFTLITETKPPTELVCPAVPTPISVECPPGFEPTNGPPLVATEPGGCGGDNRYWYRAVAPSTVALPPGSAEIQRLSFGTYNYLLAQSNGDMPTGLGCSWKYGGVTTFGCREKTPSFSPDGRLDPAGSGGVATASGGCGGGNREWYRSEVACPLGSQLIESVDFNGFNHKLCESDSPLPPGIGCSWKFGNLLSDCTTFDGCAITTDGYNLDVFSSFEGYSVNEGFFEGQREIVVTFTGSSLYRNTMGYLTYCSPAKVGPRSVTYRLNNVKVDISCASTAGCDGQLLAVAVQDGHMYWSSFGNPDSIVGSLGVYNRLTTLLIASFKKSDSSATGLQSGSLDTSRPILFGVGWGTPSDDYFLPPIQPGPTMTILFGTGSEMRFNY